jgi:hypothetical protein
MFCDAGPLLPFYMYRMHISKLAPLTRACSRKTLHTLLHVLALLSPAEALSKILHGDFENTVCIDMTLGSQRRGSIYFATLGCSLFPPSYFARQNAILREWPKKRRMFSKPLFPRCMMIADLFRPKNYIFTVRKFRKTAVSDEYVLGRQRCDSITCSAPGCSSYFLKFYMRNVLLENKMNYPDMFSKTVDAHWMCRPGSLLAFQSANSL